MPALEFTTADVPATLAQPNPYAEAVKALPVVTGDDKAGKARAFTIPAKDGAQDTAAVKTAKRQLAEAGIAAGCTVRKYVVVNDADKSTTITFWRVAKMTKAPRKPAAKKTAAAPK